MMLLRLTMRDNKMDIAKKDVLINFALFQVTWFALVMNLLDGKLGYLSVFLMLLHVLLSSKNTLREVLFVCLVVFFGVISDALMHGFYLYEFPNNESVEIIPIWLVLLWCGFALCLIRSLTWLLEFPILFILGMTVFGPLSYLAGEKLDAISMSTFAFGIAFIQWCILGGIVLALFSLFFEKPSVSLEDAL